MAGGDKPRALPVGYRGTVLLQDVADLLVQLGSGDYDRDDLYGMYMTLVEGRGRIGGNAQAFGQVLAELGCERRNIWRVP